MKTIIILYIIITFVFTILHGLLAEEYYHIITLDYIKFFFVSLLWPVWLFPIIIVGIILHMKNAINNKF